ncbi:hypothetical protein BG011_009393 [Mortierella polycephala]|uniref:NodB homology domain-containing protein n=1 Tax=Mortierella polycephala TaxID=41804 RepID=A0A9P6PN84_9FUNG|nr:hypothetical protein BG011_009393 [Mortierella polycephala]
MRCSKRLPLILSVLALPLIVFAGTANAKEKKIEDIEVFEPELWQLHAHGHHHLSKNHPNRHNNNDNNHHKHKKSSKKTKSKYKSKPSKKMSFSSQNNGRNLVQSNSDKIADYAVFEPELWQLRAHGHNHLLKSKKKKNSKKHHQKNKKSIKKKSASEKKKLDTKIVKRDLAETAGDSDLESGSNDTIKEDVEDEIARDPKHENDKNDKEPKDPEDEEHSEYNDDKDHDLGHDEDKSADEGKKDHGGKNEDKDAGGNEEGEKKERKGDKKDGKKDGKKGDRKDGKKGGKKDGHGKKGGHGKKDGHDKKDSHDKKDGQDDKKKGKDGKAPKDGANKDKAPKDDADNDSKAPKDREAPAENKAPEKKKTPVDDKAPEKKKNPADDKAPEKKKPKPAVPVPAVKPPAPAPIVPVQHMGEFLTKCNTVGQVAMTFSEGPSEATIQMLEILKEAKARVTFFANATWLDYMQYASVTRRAYQDGHLIGMTYRLPSDSSKTMTEAQLKADIAKYATKIFSLIGKYPKYVRLHDAGLKDTKLEPIIRQMGYTLVGFNLDQADYKYNTREQSDKIAEIYDTTFKKQADAFGRKSSYVVVGYDIPASGAAAALPQIINAVIRNGYDMVRLDGCNNDSAPYKKSALMNDGFVKDDFSFGGSKYVHGQSPVSVLKNGKAVPGNAPGMVGENKPSSSDSPLVAPSAMGMIFATVLALIL